MDVNLFHIFGHFLEAVVFENPFTTTFGRMQATGVRDGLWSLQDDIVFPGHVSQIKGCFDATTSVSHCKLLNVLSARFFEARFFEARF